MQTFEYKLIDLQYYQFILQIHTAWNALQHTCS